MEIKSPEEKKSIETGVSDLKETSKGNDIEDVKKKTQNLIQVSMKLGEAVYKSQQKTNLKMTKKILTIKGKTKKMLLTLILKT